MKAFQILLIGDANFFVFRFGAIVNLALTNSRKQLFYKI